MALLNLSRAAGVLALAVAAGGCGDFIRPPTRLPGDPEQLLVHALLTAGSDSVQVLVSRVGTAHGPTPVSGAQVQVIGGGVEAVLAESTRGLAPCVRGYVPPGETPPQGTNGCYTAVVPGGVRPGTEYLLEVDLGTGERVRGRTVVPAAPAFGTPEEGTRIRVAPGGYYLFASQPLTLRWEAPGGVSLRAWSERVWAPVPDAHCTAALYGTDGFDEEGHPLMELDSARRALQILDCRENVQGAQVQPDSLEVVVALTAYDPAYLEYVRSVNNGTPEGSARGGLEGAFGIFGGAATATRRVRVIADYD